ncbi:MAG: class I SAM-dependent methyltransferase [Jannaschia sp.]
MATDRIDTLPARYDRAAARWRDKMRVLGYYDGYLGFLSAPGPRPEPASRVIDVGAGTAAFSEAWVAVNGVPGDLLLLDPSAGMLDRACGILARRGVAVRTQAGYLGEEPSPDPADEVLAAHILEHVPDPLLALRQMRGLLRPGGRLRLVLSRPHWCNAIIWLQWRHRTFSRAEARDLLAAAGLRLESEYDFPSGPPSRTSRGFVAIAD